MKIKGIGDREWGIEAEATCIKWLIAAGESNERRVPKWEELVHTPVVFVRVTNKGVMGHGK